jgi:hypothetical protein
MRFYPRSSKERTLHREKYRLWPKWACEQEFRTCSERHNELRIISMEGHGASRCLHIEILGGYVAAGWGEKLFDIAARRQKHYV